MATRIVFRDGHEVTAAENLDDVVHAVTRAQPNPVLLEGAAGERIAVNWELVAYMQELADIGSAGAAAGGA